MKNRLAERLKITKPQINEFRSEYDYYTALHQWKFDVHGIVYELRHFYTKPGDFFERDFLKDCNYE